MDAKLDAKRLEELAAKCAVAIDGVGRGASYGLSEQDLADLARCAAAWAKVTGQKDNCGWFWDSTCQSLVRTVSPRYSTPIAAVESAPEVKP